MNSCHSIDSLLTPFIDGELADADRRAVEDHLRRCAPCHSREAAERAVRGLIHARRASLGAPAPAPLRDACAKIARDVASHQSSGIGHHVGSRPRTDGSRPTTDARRPTSAPAARLKSRLGPFALAASLVIVVGGAFLYQATDKSARLLAAELTADHVKCFAMNRALGTHQEVAAVESSLAAGFGWRAHLPEDPASAGLELVGSRPCLYGEGKIAHIMYRHHGKPVSLFMLPNTARTQELVEVLGHEAKIWCVGNRTFVLLSRQSKREIEQLASFVQAGLH
jgi:anti-sigma factor RsiW